MVEDKSTQDEAWGSNSNHLDGTAANGGVEHQPLNDAEKQANGTKKLEGAVSWFSLYKVH